MRLPRFAMLGLMSMAGMGISLAPAAYLAAGPAPCALIALPRRSAAGRVPHRYRARWKAARPKRHANRHHISRRVRRRHRRAA